MDDGSAKDDSGMHPLVVDEDPGVEEKLGVEDAALAAALARSLEHREDLVLQAADGKTILVQAKRSSREQQDRKDLLSLLELADSEVATLERHGFRRAVASLFFSIPLLTTLLVWLFPQLLPFLARVLITVFSVITSTAGLAATARADRQAQASRRALREIGDIARETEAEIAAHATPLARAEIRIRIARLELRSVDQVAQIIRTLARSVFPWRE